VIEVRGADGEHELTAALALRHQVFVVEQGVPVAEEIDGRDGDAEHLVALERGAVVATCRLMHRDDGATQLGRMAVARTARRRGIASALLEEAERAARRAGRDRIVLHAQTDALALYDNAGYEARGDRFMEAGIEHQPMVKVLP
jgi:predicted GNAT family N-acyltransferase